MGTCSICGRVLSFFEGVGALQTKRCPQCQQRLLSIQQHWTNIIEQTYMRGGVPVELEQTVYREFQQARMPHELGQPVIARLTYLRRLSEVQWGNVPILRTGIHLDSDEMAHFEMGATYYKPTKQVKPVPGRIVGTNKKCYFLSSTGQNSVTIDWNNVSQVGIHTIQVPVGQQARGQPARWMNAQVIHVTVSKGAGGGSYQVNDPFYAKVIIDTLVKIWKRQLVLYKEIATHGAIPEHVKAAVFKRDGGKCVLCEYSGDYIEYDHKVPRSKGGPNTVENIQLLCRKCNLKKGDRL